MLFDIAAPVAPREKVRYEGTLHRFIDGEALSHLWLGANPSSPERLAEFVTFVFHETTNRQIIFSSDFTTCRACRRTAAGLRGSCSFCASDDVEGITRITGYYSRVSGLNRGKIAELRDKRESVF